MEIFLIRHLPVLLEEGTCYGQSDVPCKEVTEEMMEAFRKACSFNCNTVVYTSPSSRCAQLARKFSNEPRVDPALMELDFGDFELQKWTALQGEVLQEWMDDYVHRKCPGGESYLDLYQRSVAAWNRIILQPEYAKIVVTHGGVIRSLLVHLLNIPLEKSFALKIETGSVTKISGQPGSWYVDYVGLPVYGGLQESPGKE